MAQEKEFQHWTVDKDNNKFVWLCLDVQESSANVLSAEVLEEFHNITGVIVTRSPRRCSYLFRKTERIYHGCGYKWFFRYE